MPNLANGKTTSVAQVELEKIRREKQRRAEARAREQAEKEQIDPLAYLWQPQSGPQDMAYNSPADITGYGGAAGGGKTDLGLGLAATRHIDTAIYRREATQVRGIIRRGKELLFGLGRLNENLGVWQDLPGNKIIQLEGVKNPNDWEKYKGIPHDLIIFDEATEFLENQVRSLTAWNRSTVPGQRCRVVLCFNPPTNSDGEWIIKFFAPWLDPEHPNPAAFGELRWFAMVDEEEVERPNGEPFVHKGETIKPRSRTFIFASVKDNRYLADTDYESNLQALPEPLRSQLLYGNFQARRKEDAMQVIPVSWVLAAQTRWKPRRVRPPELQQVEQAGARVVNNQNQSQSQQTPEQEQEKEEFLEGPYTLGVDVARGGDDQTVLCKRYGAWVAPLQVHSGDSTPTGKEVAELVIAELTRDNQVKTATVNVDVIGVGASAYDILMMSGLGVNGVNVAEKSSAYDRSGRLRFINQRAEFWWKLREALDPSNPAAMALPPDPKLRSDLCAPRWKLMPHGIQVESKDDLRGRLGRSPDRGDALMLTMKAGGAGIRRL